MNAPSSTDAENVYAFQAKDIHDSDRSLSEFRGQVLLIVNVASRCGFTPQYKDLESLYEKYRDRGFTILGFPCNQFGFQEPGSDSEIQQFCQLNFGVQFPMYSKISVNGSDAHPLYAYLKHAAPGILGTEAIKWNFTKFLVDRDGKVVGRYPPSTTPEALIGTIEKLLDAHPAQPANGS
jgi:glutathione peroxidase